MRNNVNVDCVNVFRVNSDMKINPPNVTQKLRSLRERANLSMDELAQKMGYARASSIQRYESQDFGKDHLPADFVAKLLGALHNLGQPPITAAEIWDLARPELAPAGRPLIDSYDPDADETTSEVGYTREHWRPAVDGALPEIDVKLGAGSGVVGDTINLPVGSGSVSGHPVVAEWLIPEDYLRNEAKASPRQTLVMEVVGDSMQPTYMPGDRVLVDLAQDRMASDTVYAISDGFTEPQIKRLQRVPFSNPTEVIIISDNPNLERFTVELDRLSIIGRVCGHIARK
jgi:SOS-response transcriptional repressor LexA/DNA-binding XRE family transcriptional regulator